MEGSPAALSPQARARPSRTGDQPSCVASLARGRLYGKLRQRHVHSVELVLALFIAVAALVTVARRIGVAYPIFLMIGGLVLGIVPGLPRVHIDPDVIFLTVLPPLLY